MDWDLDVILEFGGLVLGWMVKSRCERLCWSVGRGVREGGKGVG